MLGTRKEFGVQCRKMLFGEVTAEGIECGFGGNIGLEGRCIGENIGGTRV